MKPLRLIVAAKQAVFRTLPLMRDARVPSSLKWTTAIAGVAILSPLDIFGDIPVLGALDDVALLSLLCWLFVRFAERHTMRDASVRGTSLSL